MELHKNTPVFLFKTIKEWEKWLDKNHTKASAVWIKFAKKKSGAIAIAYDEALLVALSYGWIDGLINAYDEKFYLTRFTPRKPQSVWSKTNREAVERLIAERKMRPAGLATVDAAKANGNWHAAYEPGSTMQMPEDFLKELAKDKKAEKFFKTLSRANTYAIAWRLQTAKRPETREKWMNIILEMLKRGEKFH